MKSDAGLRRWFVALLILAAVAVAGWVAFRAGDGNAPGDGDDRTDDSHRLLAQRAPLPQLPVSPYWNTRAGVKYVGSRRCRECHQEVHESYVKTIHSRSLSLVSAHEQPPAGRVVHGASRRVYDVVRDGKRLVHRESLSLTDGRSVELAAYAMKYLVGSGHVARSYLAEDDGVLIQSPVSWFAKPRVWAMSPGALYRGPDQLSFLRVIKRGCLDCHSGHVERAAGGSFRFRLVERAIGCERCHGPGQLHVERHRNASAFEPDEIDRTIVNPGRLSRELSESICNQCHLQGDFQIAVRGRRPHEYRPGLRLRDFRIEFRRAETADQLKVAGHSEQMHRSRCYRASKTLTCVTCHQPHETLNAKQRIAHYRKVCNDCHGEGTCGLPLRKRLSAAGDNCVQCHMPRSDTEVTHVALTDHRIGVHVGTGPAVKRERFGPLVVLQDLSHLSPVDRDRAYGLASLQLARSESPDPARHPQYRRGFEVLSRAYRNGARDAETLTALAGVLKNRRDLSGAEKLAAQALRETRLPVQARYDARKVLAEVAFRRRRFDRAAEYLRELAPSGRNPVLYRFLAECEEKLGHTEAAVKALQRAVRLSPAVPELHQALARLLQKRGEAQQARRHARRAELLSRER